MKIQIELTESDLRKLVLDHLREKINADLEEKDVKIETKSAQNYRAEWETAKFRATVTRDQ